GVLAHRCGLLDRLPLAGGRRPGDLQCGAGADVDRGDPVGLLADRAGRRTSQLGEESRVPAGEVTDEALAVSRCPGRGEGLVVGLEVGVLAVAADRPGPRAAGVGRLGASGSEADPDGQTGGAVVAEDV